MIDFHKQGKNASEYIDSMFSLIDEIVSDREENIRSEIERMLKQWRSFIEKFKGELKSKIEEGGNINGIVTVDQLKEKLK